MAGVETTHSQEVASNLSPPSGRGLKRVDGMVNGQDTGTIDTGLDRLISVQLTSSANGHIASANSTSNGVVTVGLMADDGTAVNSDEDIYYSAVGYLDDGTG